MVQTYSPHQFFPLSCQNHVLYDGSYLCTESLHLSLGRRRERGGEGGDEGLKERRGRKRERVRRERGGGGREEEGGERVRWEERVRRERG